MFKDYVGNAVDISIHALREEGDLQGVVLHGVALNFYPRPPRGGRRQSLARLEVRTDFYPRPPRGGRPVASDLVSRLSKISIHALREEGDP